MNPAQQDKFINDILDSFQEEIKNRLKLQPGEALPENWNGIEIRQWLADLFNQHFVTASMLQGKRKKDYKNDCIVKNLV